MHAVERSPADVLRLVVAGVAVVALLIIEWLFDDELAAFGAELLSGLGAVPDWILVTVIGITRLLGMLMFGGGLIWVFVGRRWRMLITTLLAACLGGAVAAGLDASVSDSIGASAAVVAEPGLVDNVPWAGSAGLAAAAAALTAAAPWMPRRWRRWSWVLIAGLVGSQLLTDPVSFDAPRAAFVGWLCGATVLVALGAPSRRPRADAVIEGLQAVGLPVTELRGAEVDARGSVPYFGTAADGTPLFVKVLGQDERSADLLFRLYRAAQPRAFGDERPFESLRRSVEHEALIALSAAGHGIRTPRLLAFAAVEPNGYVLAYEAVRGESLDELDEAKVTDDVLAALWRLVGELRRHRIAHRDLRLANILLDDDGDPWLLDFGFSELAASDLLLANDVAELLASSSLAVGPTRALTQARRAVDASTLKAALERLHPWSLSGATRTALRARPGALAELRDGLARVTTVREVDSGRRHILDAES